MNCELFRETMFDYLGGGLDAESLGSFRAHYGSCAACAGTLRMVEAQETILTALPQAKAPPTLWGRVQAEIADRRRLEWLEGPRSRAGGWFAAAAGLLVAAGILYAAVITRSAPERPGLPIHVVDISAQPGAGALGRAVPGYENPDPSTPVFDALLGFRE